MKPNRKLQTATNKDLILDYVRNNEGCTKQQMMERFCLTINQMNNILHRSKPSIALVLTGSQISRIGTYRVRTDEDIERFVVKPTIEGARIVHAGDLLAKKYGYKSPELRKPAKVTIQSGMGGSVYD